MADLSAANERMQGHIAHLDRAIQQIEDSEEAKQRAKEIAGLKKELAVVEDKLKADAINRSIVGDLDVVVRDYVGPDPVDPAEVEAWQEAAGRTAQHRLAFDLTGNDLLGDRSRSSGPRFDHAYAGSRHSAEEALDHLEHVLGRESLRRPSLGLSL